jgi:3-hydroxyisobutyrate dehydrogenase
MANVAFIGLGKMGAGMAGRLLGAGHRLSVHNRTGGRADSLVRRGARRAATPRDACAGADAAIVMVADDDASRAVWLGADGILAAKLAPRALAVECSTLSHDWVMELAGQAGSQGLRYVDAPVTGLPEAAAAGALTLLVGAAPDDLEGARPLLSAFAERIIRFGEVGAGTVYKLMINLVGAVQIASAAEGMALAERAGLDLSLVADAIALGQAASPQVVRNTRRMADDDHDRNVVFTAALRLKDVEYALRLARKLKLEMPIGEQTAALLRRLCELGCANLNESRIIEVARVARLVED